MLRRFSLLGLAVGLALYARSTPAPAAPAPPVAPLPAAPFAAPPAKADTNRVVTVALAFSADRLQVPVAGYTPADLADSFTARRSGGRTHNAIDIMAPRGTPVVAVSDGTIARRRTNRLGGKVLYVLAPGGGYAFYYAHLDGYAPGIEDGREVRQGDTLGFVGSTGNAAATAPHLHFQVLRGRVSARNPHGGQAVNPYPMLRRSALYRSDRVRG